MKNILTLFSLFFCALVINGQDAHFSQAWNNSLQLNPAATGVYPDQIRLGAMYRTQWSGIPNAYKHYGVFADANIKKIGVGLGMFNEGAGGSSLQSTGIKLSGAYHQKLGMGNNQLSLGVQTGFLQKRIDPSLLTFDKQYDSQSGVDLSSDNGENFNNTSSMSLDFGVGLEWTLSLSENSNSYLKAGLAIGHINTPKFSLLSVEKQTIPMLWTIYGEAAFPLAEKLIVTPRFLMHHQGPAKEILLGIQSTYSLNESTKIKVGIDNRMKDALILSAGLAIKNVFVGVSYDVNISGLSTATKGNGGVELLATYRFNKPSKKVVTDTDLDGIPDWKDQCPKTPGVKELKGCPTAALTPTTQETAKIDNDRDNDGIPDNLDDCPDVPGLYRFQGCNDKDEDGIWDAIDRCPNLYGVRENGGCPVKTNDLDGDGVTDDYDHCVYIKGSVALNGCPDTDLDGVPDIEDHCPYIAGDKAANGCPSTNRSNPGYAAETDSSYPVTIVEFDTNKDIVKLPHLIQLNQMIAHMLKHDHLVVMISGHTDFEGSASYNFALSQRRTLAVQNYLIANGITTSRIRTISYGESIPKDSNDSEFGKARNRRAELILLNE